MIDILLPTYNGAVYIRQQLDSIINQTYPEWHVIIRDDGSSDDTIEIINEYIVVYPHKFSLIRDNLGNQGTSGNIDLLMHHSSADYFMFCDQDDIWEPNKIEVCMQTMTSLEVNNPQKPILVCSDACCIDENNKVICNSFFASQKFIDTTDSLYKMLALNIVQGSTTLMNRYVREVVKFIPKDYYHDAWVACIVKYYGIVQYLHQPLLRYRQHQNNVVGALNVGPQYMIGKISIIVNLFKHYKKTFALLPFRISILKWAIYKLIINLKRF